MKKLFLTSLIILLSPVAQAYTQACQLVAQMAGPAYQPKPNRFGSLTSPQDMPKSVEVTFLEQNGVWFIYQSSQDWFEKETCAPKTETIDTKTYEFLPVLLNKQTGQNAVINGIFLIKTYREKHIDMLESRYGFNKVSPLPNRFTAVFDVKPQASYDKLIETLDRDRDIDFAAPLLSEPRYKPR